jgi:hypothetical protein
MNAFIENSYKQLFPPMVSRVSDQMAKGNFNAAYQYVTSNLVSNKLQLSPPFTSPLLLHFVLS